ncbi:MAG: hypothetical protein K8R55_06400 [Desulfuromonadaceae bacterium]|nr:hypothetical protein [Desulfuromonadaceae bacterium]
MRRSTIALLLSGLLILLLAGPVLARGGNGQGGDNPNSNRQSADNATRGMERAAERRSEQATEHAQSDMDRDIDRDRTHMRNQDHEGRMDDDHGKAKMKVKSKQKGEKAAKDQGMKGRDKKGKAMKQEGEDLGKKTQKKKRWYWPFGDEE